MNKKLSFFVFFVFICFGKSYSNVIQYFFGTNYINPATFNSVQSFEFLVGAVGVNPQLTFKGSSSGGKGTAKTSETTILPYWRAGARINDRLVIGLNVSTPYYADTSYPQKSILRFDSTQTRVCNTDISPQLSCKITNKLALGVGFIANDLYNFQVNFVIPNVGNAVNKAHAWSFGWCAGLFYQMTKKDFLSAAYFSRLIPKLHGTSIAGMFVNTNFRVRGLILPATAYLNYIRMLKNNWSLSAKVYFSQWSSDKLITFEHVPVYETIRFPVKYRDTWAFEGQTFYQIDKHWSIFGGVIYDIGAANIKSRTIAFPNDNAWIVALGGGYQISNEATATIAYARAFYDTHINHPLNGLSQADGSMQVRANAIDLRFNYKF